MCVCIRSNTRLRVTTASGMNLFNLIRFEKYGGEDPSLRAIENSNSTLRLLSKNNRGEGRVEDAFKRTFKRSEKKGERDLLLVARILSIPRPVSSRRGERRLAHAIPAALATEMERERKKEEEEGDRDGEARRGAERISSEKLTRDAAKTMSRVA